MQQLDTLQSVYFDLCDLINANPSLMKKKIEGLQEFDTLGEFLQYQKEQLEIVEVDNAT